MGEGDARGRQRLAKGDEVTTPAGSGVVVSVASWPEVARQLERWDAELKAAEIRSHLGARWEDEYARVTVKVGGEVRTFEYEPVELVRSWRDVGGKR